MKADILREISHRRCYETVEQFFCEQELQQADDLEMIDD